MLSVYGYVTIWLILSSLLALRIETTKKTAGLIGIECRVIVVAVNVGNRFYDFKA